MSSIVKDKISFVFHCPIFCQKVTLYIGDPKGLEEMVNGYEHDYANRAVCITVEKNKHQAFVVWVKDVRDSYSLMHETVHLVRRIFEYVGVPFDSTNDEFIAYYQVYWVQRFNDKIDKLLKKGE